MVGVAGRSKGCKTCRRRRIKCDQARPNCNNCRKSGRPCEGYPETKFIQVNFEKHAAVAHGPSTESSSNSLGSSSGHTASSHVSELGPSATNHPAGGLCDAPNGPISTIGTPTDFQSSFPQISPPPTLEFDSETTSFDTLLRMQDTTPPPSTEFTIFTTPSQTTVPSSPPLTAFQDTIFVAYTRINLLRGVNSYPTLFQAPLTTSALPLTSTSLLSLSTTYFTLAHPSSDPSLRLTSQTRYTTALSAVNTALATSPLPSSTSSSPSPLPLDLLTAVTALALHEFLSPTTPAAAGASSGWVAHCLGLARLFELWGPHACARSAPARRLFETVRPVMVLAALAARRRSRFADEAWRRVPWEGGSGAAAPHKDRVHLLLDVLAEASGLVEGRGLAGAPVLAGTREGAVLLEEAEGLLRGLAEWRDGWDGEFPDCRREVVPALGAASSAPVGVDEAGMVGPLWRTVWQYGSLYFANVFTLYNATRLFLLMFVRAVSGPGPGSGYDEDGLARALYESATDICRSVDYHLLDFQGGAGSFFLIFPLRMAWQAFGSGDSPEAKWVEQVMDGISSGSSGRWTVANHLVQAGQS